MKLPSIFGTRGARDKPKDSYGGSAYSFFFGRSTSGKNVNERTAMQTTAVYSCVRILAEAVASLPIHVYRYTETGKERVYDHPLYYLLHDEPNPEMTSFVFRETLMSYLLIWGNAYAQVIRDGNGRVLSLYPLLPDKMEVDRDEHGQLFYTYTRNTDENPNFSEYGRVRLKPEDVLHIPGLGFDGLVGYSPIAMAKNAVGMTLACEEYGASFFENGATPGGVLEHPGVLKDPAKVRESWHSVYGGSKNDPEGTLREAAAVLGLGAAGVGQTEVLRDKSIIEEKLKKEQGRYETLLDMRMNNEIPKEVFSRKQQEVEKKIAELEQQMMQYGDVKPATEADVSGKLENLRRLMGQPPVPEDGEFSEEDIDKYVFGVRVYEERFEWLLNLSPETRGELDDAGSPVYFTKLTVTPDDERAWFKMHPQWSKSNKYAELEAWIYI